MRRILIIAAITAMSGQQLAFARAPTHQLHPSPPQPGTVIKQIQVPQFVLTHHPPKGDLTITQRIPLDIPALPISRPQAKEEAVTCQFTLDGFELNGFTLTGVQKARIGVFTKSLQGQVSVVGHSDHFGPTWAKERVATRRAQSVAAFLTSRGVNVASATGQSDHQQISTDPAKNRRVEITVLECEEK